MISDEVGSWAAVLLIVECEAILIKEYSQTGTEHDILKRSHNSLVSRPSDLYVFLARTIKSIICWQRKLSSDVKEAGL